MDRLARAVETAKAWMTENGAEVLVENLAGPAGDAAIANAEQVLGFALPSELAVLWRIHDGQRREMNGFITSLDLLSIGCSIALRDRILVAVYSLLGDQRAISDAGLRKAELDDHWLPFASRYNDHLAIHAGTGRVFRVLKDWPPVQVLAESLTAWFEGYAAGMQHGAYTVEAGFGGVYLQG